MRRALRDAGVRLVAASADTAPAAPDAQAAEWFVDERILSGFDVLVLGDHDGAAWEPELARRLSAATGGFCVSRWTERTLSTFGHFVFFAGRTVEAAASGLDSLAAPALALGGAPIGAYTEASVLLRRYFDELLFPDQGSFPPRAETEAHTWRFAGPLPFDPSRLDVTSERPLARIGVCDVERAPAGLAVRELRARGLGAGWRWRHQPAAPEHDPLGTTRPIALFQREGQPDDGLASALAELLGRETLQVGVPGAGAPFTWMRAGPGGDVARGTEQGGLALVARWRALTGPARMPVLAVCWPDDDPGEAI